MNIAKFDLYKAEWLDLVFDHRNKAYGAYELRKSYGQTMVKAMGLSFIAVVVLVIASFVFRVKPKPEYKFIPVELPTIVKPPVEAKPKKADPPKSVDPPAPAVQVKTTAIPTRVVSDDQPTVDPPVISEIKGPIGSANVDEPDKGIDNQMDQGKTQGGGGSAPADETIYTTGDVLEVMPEPVGGAAAWAKFLQKNLHFPGVAQENGVSGKVFMSFVIEKDGSLSNIKVERGAGYGFDEEATRVLKLAKAWKPGVQNGQAVRVKYTIPINFQLSEQ
jgi:protein TonB